MSWLSIWAAVAAGFGVIFVAGFLVSPPDPVRQLTALYVKLMRLGPAQGRAHLALQLEKVSAENPGRSHVWYLQKLVRELQRAKDR